MAKPAAALELDAITDDAINRVERNADPDWLETAYWVLRKLAAQQLEFSSDDIWYRLGELRVSTHEPRAMGAVIRRAIREELIVPTGKYRKSFRRACHGRPIAIWRSMLGDGRQIEPLPVKKSRSTTGVHGQRTAAA